MINTKNNVYAFDVARTVEFKMFNVDENFKTQHNNNIKMTKKLVEFIGVLGNDIVYTTAKDENGYPLRKNLVDMRKVIYNEYINTQLISFEEFSTLGKELYTDFISASARSMVSSLFNTSRIKQNLDDISEKIDENLEDISDSTKANKKAESTIKKLYLFAIKPFSFTSILTTNDKYTIVSCAHRILTANNNENITKFYKQHEEQLSDVIKTLTTVEYTACKDMYDFFVDSNILKHFDAASKSYIMDCVVPQLLTSGCVSQHYYLSHKNKKKSYSLNDMAVQYIQQNQVLLNKNSSGEYLISAAIKLGNLTEKLKRLRDGSAFPFVTDDSQVQSLFGANYYKYDLKSQSGIQLDTNIEIQYLYKGKVIPVISNNGIQVDKKLELYGKSSPKKIGDIYIESYRNHNLNPGKYFKNLKLYSDSNTKNNTFVMTYTRGKYNKEVTALLKEPTIIKRGNDYYFRFNLALPYMCDDDLYYTLNTSYDKYNSTKNTERIEKILNKPFNILGVDLGLTTPFAYSIINTNMEKPLPDYTIVKRGEFNNSHIESSNYTEFKRYERLYGNILSYVYSIQESTTDEFPIEKFGLIEKFVEEIKQFYKTRKLPNKLYINEFINDSDWNNTLIQQVKKHSDKLFNIKEDITSYFLNNVVLDFIQKKFHEQVNNRKYHIQTYGNVDGKINQSIKWVSVIDTMINLYKKHFRFGKPSQQFGEKNTLDLSNMILYRKHVKSDALKQYAAELINIALHNNCKIIAMEILKQRDSAKNSKDENILKALWSPSEMKNAIENAATQNGISVSYVDEYLTSQVHHDSGAFGSRDGKKLFYLDDHDNLMIDDADINASSNIGKRLLHAHTDFRQLKISRLKKCDNDTGGLQFKGFLRKEFGITKLTQSNLHSLPIVISDAVVRYNKTGIDEILYKHKSTWITSSEKLSLIDKIDIKRGVVREAVVHDFSGICARTS